MMEGLYKIKESIRSIRNKAEREQAASDLNRLIDIARLAGANRQDGPMDGLMMSTIHREIEALEDRFDALRKPIQDMLKNTSASLEKMERLSMFSVTPSLQTVDEYGRFSVGMMALSITNPGLKTTLDSLLVDLNFPENQKKVPEKFVAHVGGWFTSVMDRLTGIYKRKVQLMTFSIALLSAFILNIDSINITRMLWQNPMEREILTAEAERVVAGYSSEPAAMSKEEALRLLDEYSTRIALPIGWQGTWQSGACIKDDAVSFSPGIKMFGFCYLLDELESAPLSLSWVMIKLTGFLITAIAAVQGSSFWFDVLTRFVNVRSSGATPG
jgi:hypothetical protein